MVTEMSQNGLDPFRDQYVVEVVCWRHWDVLFFALRDFSAPSIHQLDFLFDRHPEVSILEFLLVAAPASQFKMHGCGWSTVCRQGPIVQQANLPPDQSETGMLPFASRKICCNRALDISGCEGLHCTFLGSLHFCWLIALHLFIFHTWRILLEMIEHQTLVVHQEGTFARCRYRRFPTLWNERPGRPHFVRFHWKFVCQLHQSHYAILVFCIQ